MVIVVVAAVVVGVGSVLTEGVTSASLCLVVACTEPLVGSVLVGRGAGSPVVKGEVP